MDYFKTVGSHGTAEVVIKRSRFIGDARAVETEEEAVRFVETIRKLHTAAAHHCYAYVIGERDECQKQSDDGEPSGTAGKPILETIKQQGLKNTVVVVTRYFGGVLLGAGGLIRAYTDGAVAGIAAAGPVYQALHTEVFAEIDYTWLGKVEHELHRRGTFTGETAFADRVRLLCLPLRSQAESFIAWLTDITQGQADIQIGDSRYIPHASPPSE